MAIDRSNNNRSLSAVRHNNHHQHPRQITIRFLGVLFVLFEQTPVIPFTLILFTSGVIDILKIVMRHLTDISIPASGNVTAKINAVCFHIEARMGLQNGGTEFSSDGFTRCVNNVARFMRFHARFSGNDDHYEIIDDFFAQVVAIIIWRHRKSRNIVQILQSLCNTVSSMDIDIFDNDEFFSLLITYLFGYSLSESVGEERDLLIFLAVIINRVSDTQEREYDETSSLPLEDIILNVNTIVNNGVEDEIDGDFQYF